MPYSVPAVRRSIYGTNTRVQKQCIFHALGESKKLPAGIQCIAGHVLEDFLLEKGNEVKQVAALDYTFERREKLFRAEEREQGRKEGLAEGLAEGHAEGLAEGITQGELLARIKIICVKLQKSQTIEQISDALEENPKIIEKIVTIANEYAPNYDVEEITKRYMNL